MKRVVIFVLLVMMLIPGMALAGDKPLSLDTANVEDGQTDVPTNIAIELVFTNNVVNQSVRENNMQCITLTSAGSEVAVDIVMADDQVEPDKKQIINVVPKEELAQGQPYELKISGMMTAKNGNAIGEDTVISFTTEGVAAQSFSYWWIIVIAAVVIIAIVVIILTKNKRGSKA